LHYGTQVHAKKQPTRPAGTNGNQCHPEHSIRGLDQEGDLVPLAAYGQAAAIGSSPSGPTREFGVMWVCAVPISPLCWRKTL
jgi:hypothetical protein